MMVAICYLEKENDKTFKFQMNNWITVLTLNKYLPLQ